MPELIYKPLTYYTERLKDKPFSFVRYQDGDLNCLRGKGRYTQSHSFFKDMTEEAVNTLTNPHLTDNYIYGTTEYEHGILEYNSKIPWHFSDVFTISLSFGNLAPMIKQLRKMKVVVVGSEFLRALNERVFPYYAFIEVPYENCWTERPRIEKEIREAIQDDCVIVFASGTMTDILIHKLYPEFGDKCYMIDFGCMLDFLCEHIIRRDWNMRAGRDSTWIKRVIDHALGEDGISGPLPNPVYLGEEGTDQMITINSVIKENNNGNE